MTLVWQLKVSTLVLPVNDDEAYQESGSPREDGSDGGSDMRELGDRLLPHRPFKREAQQRTVHLPCRLRAAEQQPLRAPHPKARGRDGVQLLEEPGDVVVEFLRPQAPSSSEGDHTTLVTRV